MRPTGPHPNALDEPAVPLRPDGGRRLLVAGVLCGALLALSNGAVSAQGARGMERARPAAPVGRLVSDRPVKPFADRPVKPLADLDAGGVLPYVDSFEDALAGWTIGGLGTVTTLSDAQFTREPVNDGRDIVTPDGARMAFLCSGPGERGSVNLGDLDGDPDDNSDNDRAFISQSFNLGPTQVPATLSFDWNFLTAESDGSFSPDPFDDFFIVTLDGVPILKGSVPGGGPSPFPDVPVDGVRVLQGNSGCSFEWGQSGFSKFQQLITTSGSHEIRFLVSDQGENDFRIDTGLLLDNLRIEPEVDLKITKTSLPDPAIAGQPLFYEITVTNLGTGRATDVQVHDTLPPQVRYISANAPPTTNGINLVVVDPACTETAPGSGLVNCQLGTMNGGETKVFTIQVDVDPEAVANGFEKMTNNVSVSSFQVDADPSNNVFSQVAFLDDLADLRVWKVSKPDERVRAGEIFTYTLLMENLGPSTAREVRLDDTVLFNSNVTLLNVLLDPTRADSCTQVPAPAPQTGRILRCAMGESLEPVGSGLGTGRWTIQVEARATQATDVDNEVHVYTVDAITGRSPGTPDPDLANNYATDRISVLDTSNLSLTKSATGQVRSAANCALTTPTASQVTAGLQLTYNLAVTNIPPATLGAPGGSIATNVVIEDFLPHGLELVSVIGVGPSGAAGCHAGTPGNPGDPTRCTYATLAVNQVGTMTVVVRVDDDYVGRSGTNLLQNSAQTRSDNIDPSLQNNWVNQITTVGEVADVSITKTSTPNPANAGEALSYELVVTNNGPSTAREVIIRDTLPAGVVFHSARIENLQGRENCTYSAGAHQVICSGFDIPPVEPGTGVGQRRVFINTRVKPDTAPGAIGNTATATTTQTPDCNPVNNATTITTNITAIADLEIVKTSTPVKVFAGEQKKYTITVTNHGPSFAQNVEVFDVLPDELDYQIDTNAPMCTRPANLIGWRAVLSGLNEVPPVVNTAAGLATFILDTAANRLVYSVQVSDIDNLTDAHIHIGAAGVNGPVIINLMNPPAPPPFSPTSSVVGELFLTPAQAAALAANPPGFYVNVHSTDFPGGEMRGQLATTRTSPLLCPQGIIEPQGASPARDSADSGGGVRSFDIYTVVRPEIFSGTTITNVAIVTSPTEPDRDLNPNPGVTNSDVYTLGANNVSARKNLVLTKSDLKVTKFGLNNGQVRAGQILTYTVIVDNLGPSYAETVSLKDVLQSAEIFDLIDITSDRATTCRSLTAAGTETNAIAGTPWPPALAPVPYFGVLEPTGIPQIGQRLQVDCTLTQNDIPATPRNESQLAVLRADGPPNSGRWILTMRVRFTQAQDIHNVADVLSATAEDPNTANNHAEVVHEITDVANLSIVKTAVGEVQVTGQAGLIYNTTGAAPAFPQAPNYTTSPTLATAGRRIRYTLRIQNAGPSDAENVFVTDRLPPGVTILPGSVVATVDNMAPLPAGTCETGTPGDPADRLVCGLGTLLGVETGVRRGATITYDVLVDPSLQAGAVLENDAFVASDVFDPFNQNNHTHVELVVDTDADLSTSKTAIGQNVIGYDVANQRFTLADQANRVTAGLVLHYELAVQNNGPSDSNNVTLSDVLPAGVRLLRVNGASCRPTEVGGSTLYCTVGDMPVGSRRTFDIYVTVDQAVANNTVLQNCVTSLFLGATPPGQPPALPPPAPTLPLTDDPLSTNNQACNNTTVNAVADVGGPQTGPATSGALSFISKKDVPAEPRLDMVNEPDLAIAGNEHRYRIRFGNAGPS
ncbi:MAG: CHRD domain-containing protein, partial [Ardenticatenales bacterium]